MKNKITEAAQGIMQYINNIGVEIADDNKAKHIKECIEHAIKNVVRDAYTEVRNEIANKAINLY